MPFYRGRNILNWALINDEREFGITAHYVDTGIDTGDILVQKCYEINDDDTYASLLERAYVGCADVLCEAINLFKSGTPKGKSQSEIDAVGFYCSQRKSGDERLNFNQSSRDVFNFVRAISKPAVMARAMLNGYEMSINKVELIPNAPIYKGIAGAILAKDENGFLVKTADSFVRVVQWEFEGKFKIGDRFE